MAPFSTTQPYIAMGISKYLKEIARGKDGARSLTRHQAADLMGQVLDGQLPVPEPIALQVAHIVRLTEQI